MTLTVTPVFHSVTLTFQTSHIDLTEVRSLCGLLTNDRLHDNLFPIGCKIAKFSAEIRKCTVYLGTELWVPPSRSFRQYLRK